MNIFQELDLFLYGRVLSCNIIPWNYCVARVTEKAYKKKGRCDSVHTPLLYD